jgi:hypothetical protein
MASPIRLTELAASALDAARRAGMSIITAESCTAGRLAWLLSEAPGAAEFMHDGYVAYTKANKAGSLGVSVALLDTKGAVCDEVALAMAQGALVRSPAQLVWRSRELPVQNRTRTAIRLGWSASRWLAGKVRFNSARGSTTRSAGSRFAIVQCKMHSSFSWTSSSAAAGFRRNPRSGANRPIDWDPETSICVGSAAKTVPVAHPRQAGFGSFSSRRSRAAWLTHYAPMAKIRDGRVETSQPFHATEKVPEITTRPDPKIRRSVGSGSEPIPCPERCRNTHRDFSWRRSAMTQTRTQAPAASMTRSGKPLIESDRVEGTTVYNANGDDLGSIKRLMIDKVSGRVAYAVMTFGGFLGIGEEEHAIPWAKLIYDTNLGGYRTDLTVDELQRSPTFSRDSEYDWSDRTRERELHDHYRVPYYWGS